MNNEFKEFINVYQKETKELEKVKEFFEKEQRERNTKGGWIGWWLKRSLTNIKSVLGMYKVLAPLVGLALGKIGFDVFTHKTLSPVYIMISAACTVVVLYIISMVTTYLNLTKIGHLDAHLDKYKSSKSFEYNLYTDLLQIRKEMTNEKVNAIAESTLVNGTTLVELQQSHREEITKQTEILQLALNDLVTINELTEYKNKTLVQIISLLNEKHQSINESSFSLKEFAFTNGFTLYRKEGNYLYNIERYKVSKTHFPFKLSLTDTEFSMVNAVCTEEKSLVQMEFGKNIVFSFKVIVRNVEYIYSFHFSKYDILLLRDFLINGEYILLLEAIEIILERLINEGILDNNSGEGGLTYVNSNEELGSKNQVYREENIETNSERTNKKETRIGTYYSSSNKQS